MSLKKNFTDEELKEGRQSDASYYLASLKGAFRNIRNLQEAEKTEHSNTDVTGYVDDDYSYFHPENFLKGLSYSDAAMKKAQGFIKNNKVSNFEVTVVMDTSNPDHPLIGSSRIYIYDDKSKYYACMVDISFSSERIRSCSCLAWSCRHQSDKSPLGHKLCEHELAAILTIQTYVKEHNIGDKTDMTSYSFLSELGAAPKDVDNSRRRELKIEPYLTRNDKAGLSVSFRTGYDKLYKIKDLEEVRDAIQKGGTIAFGKNTGIMMDISSLSKEAKEWYAFIDNALEEQEMQIDYFDSNKKSYHTNTYKRYKSSIPLFGKNLDSFFEISSGKEIEITVDKDGHKEKKILSFEDSDFRLKLKVKPDNEGGVFHGVAVTGNFPDLYRGQSRYYRLEGSTLSRLPGEMSRRMRSLFTAYKSGKVDIHVGRRNLKPFYREALPRLMEFADVETEEKELIESHIPPVPQFYIYLDCQDGYMICRTEAYYGEKITDPSDLLTVRNPERDLPRFRDLNLEDKLIFAILKYIKGFDPSERVFLAEKNDTETYDFLTAGMEELSSLAEIRATERFRRILRPKRSAFSVGVSVSSDIMNLNVVGEDLTDDEVYDILNAYKRKQRFYKLKDGSFMSFENDEALSKLSELMDSLHLTPKEFVKGKMNIPLYRALYVERMLEDSEDLRLDRDKKFRNLIREFKSVENADFELPSHMRKIMREYQTTGYRWMMSLDHYGFGGILADEMGLGKTMQAIAVMSSVLNGSDGRALVVCPASLVYNWYEEIMKYSKELDPTVIAGSATERERLITGNDKGKVWITSYDLLKRDIASYEGVSFRLFFIDEAQYIKNQTTAAAKSVRLISSTTRFALTGTPIENRLGELWSIFEFLMPGFLYDYPEFKSDIETPIVKDQDEAAGERLKKMVSPFILRRRKKDVLKELPDKLEETRFARMEKPQAKLYDAQATHMKSFIGMKSDADLTKSRIEILAELMKLRQICCDPGLCFDGYKSGSAKREMCMELLQSLADGGHKTLLFSQFTTMLELIEHDLDKAGLKYYKITGATPKEQRLKLVNAFNEDSTPVFLISLKAGGTGLNLTGADSVVHYDPWWNISAENQATDRAHRIGQKNIVTVYKLIIKGSIEEKIVKLQEDKAKLAEDILSAEGISSSALNREELMELLV